MESKIYGLAIAVVVILAVSAVVAFGLGPGTEGNIINPSGPSGSAPVTIIEYSDFQCPYCSTVVSTLKQVKQTYGDDVEVIYRHFPLSFHDQAQKAAEASECAREQGRFWEYHDKVFENQAYLSVDNFKQWAADLGLNTEQFNACLDSGKYAAKVQNDLQEGLAAGVSGTPTFFINGQKLVGAKPFSEFKKIIDDELGSCIPCTEQQNCGRPSCEAITGGSCGC